MTNFQRIGSGQVVDHQEFSKNLRFQTFIKLCQGTHIDEHDDALWCVPLRKPVFNFGDDISDGGG